MFGSLSIGRERQKAMTAPIATGIGLVALAGVVTVVDPHDSDITPPCPFRLITGWSCPACGMTRSVHHLAHGDVVASLSDNLFTVAVMAAIAVSWWSWMASTRNPTQQPTRQVPRVAYVAIAVVALAYTVVRNLPTMSWLRGA